MTRNRVLGFVVLAAFVCTLTGFHAREAYALVPAPFKWATYKGKDGKDYDHPKWHDAGGGKRELIDALGTLTFKQNPPVTKVIFKVYQHGAQGGWNPTPVISYQLNPAPTYDAVVGGWTLVGKDDNVPKLRFDEGQELKIVWEVTTTENGVNTVELVEVIITVNYHAH